MQYLQYLQYLQYFYFTFLQLHRASIRSSYSSDKTLPRNINQYILLKWDNPINQFKLTILCSKNGEYNIFLLHESTIIIKRLIVWKFHVHRVEKKIINNNKLKNIFEQQTWKENKLKICFCELPKFKIYCSFHY